MTLTMSEPTEAERAFGIRRYRAQFCNDLVRARHAGPFRK